MDFPAASERHIQGKMLFPTSIFPFYLRYVCSFSADVGSLVEKMLSQKKGAGLCVRSVESALVAINEVDNTMHCNSTPTQTTAYKLITWYFSNLYI